MSQSLNKVYIHIVFSTKGRKHLITGDIREELFSYLGGICQKLECHPVQVGGYKNHIHILCILSKHITMSNLLEETKRSSSKWIKTKGYRFARFFWQNGYAVFSVGPSSVERVKNYILDQERHHTGQTYEDEARWFFKNNNIDYDERYVWD